MDDTAIFLVLHVVALMFNPSTAKGGKITPQSKFFPITQTTQPAAKIPFVTFPEYVFCTEWC